MTAVDLARTLRQEGRGDRRLRSLPALLRLQRHRQRPDREGGEGVPLRGAEPAPRGDHRHRAGADLPVAPRGWRADGGRGRRRIKKTLLDGKAVPEDPRSRAQDQSLAHRASGGSASTARRTRRGSAATPRTCCAPPRATSCSPPGWRCRELDVQRRGDHPLDARGRVAHERVPEQVQGHRPHRRASPRAREGAFGHHQRRDRRGDGPLHAEERHGRDQGAGRGGGARARQVRPGLDVPGVRRHGHAERRRALHRLRRQRFRGDLAGDDREDRRGRRRAAGRDHLRRPQAALDRGGAQGRSGP